jgi:glycosyltransferase involved in cell wall biosynthesis
MSKPIVSTSIGCEGLRIKRDENIFVADAPGEFAQRIAQLLEDQELRWRLGFAGRQLVEREYNWETIGEQLGEAYKSALQSPSGRFSGTAVPASGRGA